MYGNVSYLPEHFKNHGYHTQGIGNIMHVVDRKEKDDVIQEKKTDMASWSAPRWEPELPSPPSWAPDGWTIPQAMAPYSTDNSRLIMRRRMQVLRSQGQDFVSNIKRWQAPATEMDDVPDNAYPAGKLTDRTIKFLEEFEEKRRSPFFLVLDYTVTHSPWCAPKKYWDRYEPENLVPPETSSFPSGTPECASHPQAALLSPHGRRLERGTTSLRDAIFCPVCPDSVGQPFKEPIMIPLMK